MTLGMYLYLLFILFLGITTGLIIYSRQNKITIRQAIKIKVMVLKLQIFKKL